MHIEEGEVDESIIPLCLKSTDISTNNTLASYFPMSVIVQNNVESIERSKTKMTWNIDMESLLGNYYNDCDVFNLELTQVFAIPRSSGGSTFSNSTEISRRIINMWVSGLSWVNSSFLVQSGNNRDKAYLGCLTTNASNATWWASADMTFTCGDYLNSNLLFRKNGKYEKLTIEFGFLSGSNPDIVPDDHITSLNFIMYHTAFRFNIYPITKK